MSASKMLTIGAFSFLSMLPAIGAQAQTWTPSILATFSGPNGAYPEPEGALIADVAGNLYGTTEKGGTSNDGTVFEFSPPSAGNDNWTETLLISFKGTDGEYPAGGLIADAAGNFYGTTSAGGASGDGTVFELSPPAAGKAKWTRRVLASLRGHDGMYPLGSLIIDAAGNLYGTASNGGASSNGTVFELSPPDAGRNRWTQRVLISFNGHDGMSPEGSLIADAAGNLYGTTREGGGSGSGAIFRLSPPAAGNTKWTETVLSSFHGMDGAGPYGSLIADAAGNLYGTTGIGGAGLSDAGTVFKLSRPAAGKTRWTETVLYSFTGLGNGYPLSGLIKDAAGNFYGTADNVFKLSPPVGGKGKWTEAVLVTFPGDGGEQPQASLLADAEGNLYGTTTQGGGYQVGTVFKLSP